jgi:hypothetical protein
MKLEFGLSAAIPEAVTTAWGARLIFPDDLLFDRQDMHGDDVPALRGWLNGAGSSVGALRRALAEARRLADRYKLTRDGRQTVTLFRDKTGVVVACPNASAGYLYVAAWLHNGEADRQPAAEFGA